VPATRFRFGRCELAPATRELRVDGEPCPLAPLAFDLLVHLLRHRERAVSKDELLDRVWSGRAVTVGAIARAVMVVRQAIRDDADMPMIRTEHRTGYRFIGAVEENMVEEAAGTAPRNAGEPVLFALLPMNRPALGQPLDRSTLAALTLVGHAVATDLRLAPLPMHTLEAALRRLPTDQDTAGQVAALQRGEGVQHVLHAGITMGPEGCRLDYRMLTVPGHAGDTLSAADPVEAGHALGGRLVQAWRLGEPPPPDGFAMRDTWALELFARAMQASAEGHWRRAAHLLRVVLDREPCHPAARQALASVEARQRPRASTSD
jgi:DNA-binding winged helix-turn-helix (wHTH) protein